MPEDQPRDLVDGLHDEFALVMAGLDDHWLPGALAIARVRSASRVLVLAVRFSACAALACRLDDEHVADIYLGSYPSLISAR